MEAKREEFEIQRQIVIFEKRREDDLKLIAKLREKEIEAQKLKDVASSAREKTGGFLNSAIGVGLEFTGLNTIIDPDATNEKYRQAAAEADRMAREILSAKDEENITRIQEAASGGSKKLDELKERLSKASEKVLESTLNVGIVDNASKELESLADTLQEKGTELIQVQDSTKRAKSLAGEVASGISNLSGLTEGLADDRAFEKRAIEDITKLYQEKLSDGILDANDLAEIQRVASQFALSLGGLKTDTGKAVGNLQSSLESLILQVSTLNARQIKIDSATKKLEAQVQASKGR